MKKSGSFIVLFGSLFAMIAAVVTLFVGGVGAALGGGSSVMSFGLMGLLLSMVIFILSIISFSRKTNGVGISMLVLSLANVMGGGTFVAFTMVLCISGAILYVIGTRKVCDPDGTPVPGNVTFRNFYKKWWIWLLILVFFWVVSTINKAVEESDSPKQVEESDIISGPAQAASENVVELSSASELVLAYESNEVTASSKYLNKIIKVSGIIDSIDSSEDGTFTISLEHRGNFLDNFKGHFSGTANLEQVSNYAKGERITMIGTFTGKDIWGDYNLKGAKIVNEANQ